MSEEQTGQQPEDGDQGQPEPDPGQGPPPGAGPSAAAADDAADEGELAEAAGGDDGIRDVWETMESNKARSGTLVLHLHSRDVHTVMDGDAALRLLKMFHVRNGQVLTDRFSPFSSSAADGWFVIDLEEVTAMSWIPGDPSKLPRTVVDPLSAQAA